MNKKNFHKILIANRGEIAVRVIKAIREFGKQAIVIYADADRELPFVRQADEAWSLGSGTLSETYLNQEKIIKIAKSAGADAIHPGYGFLSENAAFSRLCAENNISFIGPGPEVIDLMGNKSKARETAKKYKVPVIEGLTGSVKDIQKQADTLVYPVLIKPSAGGGGKGMRIVHKNSELKSALEDATRESLNYFGSDELYVEHYFKKARHIEVQVLADHYGNAIHLFERECTLQRRYQKIIEEAPAASISPETRKRICDSALLLTRNIEYRNAGTIEFLMDEDENFYFIEMNTRIQVEHPVSEMITGVDIVARQIQIAEGHPLSIRQEDIEMNGHAIEARIYAEDPQKGFLPSTGKIRSFDRSHVRGRVDDGYRAGDTISPFYDPMIAKVISHAERRDIAAESLVNDLKNYHLSGISTNREFLMTLLQSDDFASNEVYTKYIDDHIDAILASSEQKKKKADISLMLSLAATVSLANNYNGNSASSVWNEIGYWRHLPEIPLKYNNTAYNIPVRIIKPHSAFLLEIEDDKKEMVLLERNDNFYKLLHNGRQVECWADIHISEIVLEFDQCTHLVYREDISDPERLKYGNAQAKKGLQKEITAPLNGKIIQINVKKGSKVREGDTVLIIESMKMENKITAPRNAVIDNIHVKTGELVELNKPLVTLK